MNASQHGAMTKVYLGVFGALAALTLITVGITYLELSRPLAISVALLVASVKMTLIASFFMHLKFEGWAIRALLFAAVVFIAGFLLSVLPDIGMR